jgi:hypothetical protein
MDPQELHQAEEEEDEPRANEPAEIRRQTKSNLYDTLAEQFYLPKKNSKGVNRAYLVGVYTQQFFRVELRELKRFQAELTPAQTKKTPLLNLTDLYSKVTSLVVEYGGHPLGFRQGAIPEEAWLLGITRYVDRANLTGAFTRPIPGHVPRICLSQRIKNAQERAKVYLLQGIAPDNAKISSLKLNVWEANKKRINLNKDIGEAERFLDNLRRKLLVEEAELRGKLSEFAKAIIAHISVVENRPELNDIENPESRAALNARTQA